MSTENKVPLDRALHFLTAGKAVAILHSEKSGNKWRIRIWKKTEDVWYVYDQTPIAAPSEIYLGCIRHANNMQSGEWWFKPSGNVPPASLDLMRLMRWLIPHLEKGTVDPRLHIYHTGICAVCNRPLTDPESVLIGIGPECRKRLDV